MDTKTTLMKTLDELPEVMTQEVLDFALFLRDKWERAEEEEDLQSAQIALAEEGQISLADVKKSLGL